MGGSLNALEDALETLKDRQEQIKARIEEAEAELEELKPQRYGDPGKPFPWPFEKSGGTHYGALKTGTTSSS